MIDRIFYIIVLLINLFPHDSVFVHSGIELSFPRHGEIMVGENCRIHEQVSIFVCEFPLYIFGWFREGEKYDTPLYLNITLDNVLNNIVQIKYVSNRMFEATTTSNIAVGITRIVNFRLQIYDKNNTLFLDDTFTTLLMLPEEYYDSVKKPSFVTMLDSLYMNNQPTEQTTFKPISNNPKNHIDSVLQQFFQLPIDGALLDFLEIGTCDVDTIIQGVYNLTNYNSIALSASNRALVETLKHKQYRGISIDAINIFLNKLPNLPHVLKLHTALSPLSQKPFPSSPIIAQSELDAIASFLSSLNKSAIQWPRVYYLPDYFVLQHFAEHSWLRESSQLNQIKPDIGFYLNNANLSGGMIQKEHIPAVPIAWLLARILDYGNTSVSVNTEAGLTSSAKKGITVVKFDIEGLDWIVVREMISFYKLVFSQLTAEWPCVIFFEHDVTEYVRKHYIEKTNLHIRESVDEDHDKVMQPLKDVGYKLLHEQNAVFANALYELRLFIQNVVAINCFCPLKTVMEGIFLLDLFSEYDIQAVQIQDACKI